MRICQNEDWKHDHIDNHPASRADRGGYNGFHASYGLGDIWMSEDQENPRAFPVAMPDGQGGGVISYGMSQRDWFAGQALVGIGTWVPKWCEPQLGNPQTMASRARWAYQQADAMLAARTGES